MAQAPLACTVRGCGQPLTRESRRFVCPRGHAYDLARSGYVNLLQPQDRRSATPGDQKDVVLARAAVLTAGVGGALVRRISELLQPRVHGDDVVIDLGCGTGDALATLVDGTSRRGIGIDLSTAAMELAAKRFPRLCWVVANADRRLPILDDSVAAVLSLHGRRNAGECARVLRGGGHVLAAVPAPDDLIELRTALHGTATAESRESSVLAEYEKAFVLAERAAVRDRLSLSPEALRALLRATYRGARTRIAGRAETISSLDVTMSSEIFVFRRR